MDSTLLYAPDAPTIWIYHASPHTPHAAHPEIHTALPIIQRHPTHPSHIIFSFLSKLCRFAFFIDQVSGSYVNTLWTQAFTIFPFMRYDSPRAVRLEDISLNFAEALALAVSSAPPSAPSVSVMNLLVHKLFSCSRNRSGETGLLKEPV